MAKSLTTRLGLQRWSDDVADTQSRAEFDNDNAQLEDLVAKTAHGTIGLRPAAGAAWEDSFYLVTDGTGGGIVGALYYCDGTAWTRVNPPKTIRIPHTFEVRGLVAVASGDTDYINPIIIAAPAGQAVSLTYWRYILRSGSTASFKLQVNGADVTGFSSTATGGTGVGGVDVMPDVPLADADVLALVVTGVSGAPKNLAVSVYLDYTV